MRALLILLAATLNAQTLPLAEILSRVSEEADVFHRRAADLVAKETLDQRSIKPPKRFQPRIANTPPAPPAYQQRQIVSEYSYGVFRNALGELHEFRQVISVDNRAIKTPEKARRTLSLGLRSEDDRARKRLLQDFQRYGLTEVASDFGQLLLLFSKRQLHDYDFRVEGVACVGADETVVLAYDQRGNANQMLVFEGKKTLRPKIQGRIWVRQSDGMPLRISLVSQWQEERRTRRHEALVEYRQAPFGVMVPASVVHREYLDKLLIAENLYRYDEFRKFGADAEIKFDAAPPEK